MQKKKKAIYKVIIGDRINFFPILSCFSLYFQGYNMKSCDEQKRIAG